MNSHLGVAFSVENISYAQFIRDHQELVLNHIGVMPYPFRYDEREFFKEKNLPKLADSFNEELKKLQIEPHSISISIESNLAKLKRVTLPPNLDEKGEFEQALGWLKRAKATYYDDPFFNFFIGVSSLETGNYEEALKYFNRQLEINPDEPSPLYNIACVYAVQGKKKEAISWLERSIVAYPKFKESVKNDKNFHNIKSSEEFKKLIK